MNIIDFKYIDLLLRILTFPINWWISFLISPYLIWVLPRTEIKINRTNVGMETSEMAHMRRFRYLEANIMFPVLSLAILGFVEGFAIHAKNNIFRFALVVAGLLLLLNILKSISRYSIAPEKLPK